MTTAMTREQIEKMKANARDWAIWAVDGVHGYTMEHSSDPNGHRDEYDSHEASFITLCNMALAYTTSRQVALAEAAHKVAELAAQKTSREMTREQRRWADWQGAYDKIIEISRALASLPGDKG